MQITDGQIITLKSISNSRYSSRIYYTGSGLQKIQAIKDAIDSPSKFVVKIISESETPIVSLRGDNNALWRVNKSENNLNEIYCDDNRQDDSVVFTLFPTEASGDIFSIRSKLNNLFVGVGDDDSALLASEINQFQSKCQFLLQPAS